MFALVSRLSATPRISNLSNTQLPVNSKCTNFKFQHVARRSPATQLGVSFFGTKVDANELKRGDYVYHKVVTTKHVSQGRGGAFIQAELSEVGKGGKIPHRYRSAESVETPDVETSRYELEEKIKDKYVFKNLDDGETLELDSKFVGPLEEDEVMLTVLDEKPLKLEFPVEVEIEVASAEVGAPDRDKKVTLTNGRVIKVPPYIEKGQIIAVKLPEETFLRKVE